MNKILLSIVLLMFTIISVTVAGEVVAKKEPHTFVIVHGASGGGWDWKTIDKHLSEKGHTVYRPTLTGLEEKVHLSNPDINLTTHINDIVNPNVA